MENSISIIVTAQDKKTWLRQKIDPRSWVRHFGEKFIPEYQEKMNVLREVDNQIYEWTKDFSSSIFSINREMKNALQSNRFVDLAILLSSLNDKLKNVINEGKKVEDIAGESLTEFDIQNQELPEDFSMDDDGIISEAQFFQNFKRKWVAERMQTKERKARFRALEGIILKAKNTIQKVNAILEAMHVARAHGKIGDYINLLKRIEKEQNLFQQAFFPVYNRYLKPLVDLVKTRQKEEEEKYKQEHPSGIITTPSSEEFAENYTEPSEEEKKELEDKIISKMRENERTTIPGSPSPHLFEVTPKLPQDEKLKVTRVQGPKDLSKAKGRPTKQIPVPEQKIEEPEESEDRKTIPDVQEPVKKQKKKKTTTETKEVTTAFVNHKNLSFLSNLIKLARQDNPYEFGATLLLYANKIDDEQPEVAEQLTQIAEQLIS